METIINNIKKLLGLDVRTFDDKLQAETAKQQIDVSIEERAGRLWIVYTDNTSKDSQAFTDIDPSMTVKEAIELLEATRRAAVEYTMSILKKQ